MMIQIVMVRGGLLGRCISGFSPLLQFFLLLLIPLSSFHGFRGEFYDLSDILYIFRHSITQVFETIAKAFFYSIHAMTSFFHVVFDVIIIFLPFLAKIPFFLLVNEVVRENYTQLQTYPAMFF